MIEEEAADWNIEYIQDNDKLEEQLEALPHLKKEKSSPPVMQQQESGSGSPATLEQLQPQDNAKRLSGDK